MDVRGQVNVIGADQLLLNYVYLQVLDLLTTIAFLIHGVAEGNPFVRFAMSHWSDPLGGLVLVKIFAVWLGMWCWRRSRLRALRKMNLLFAVVVAWNLAAIITKSLS